MNEMFVKRFLDRNHAHTEDFDTKLAEFQDGQQPDVVTVSCGDSRVLQDAMVDNDSPSWLFTQSNIGNRSYEKAGDDKFVSGDFLYPVLHAGTEEMIVIGHTGCGAVTVTHAYLSGEGLEDEPKGITYAVEELLAPEIADGFESLPDGLSTEEEINSLVEYNVDSQIAFLVDRLEVIRANGQVGDGVDVYGMVYDLQGVYGGGKGELYLINVNGVRDKETLQEQYGEVADRVDRLWEY